MLYTHVHPIIKASASFNTGQHFASLSSQLSRLLGQNFPDFRGSAKTHASDSDIC